MSDSTQSQYTILIDIQAKLAALAQVQQGFRKAREEGESFGTLIAQGFGIGTGMELARRGIELVKSSIESAVESAFQLAKEIKQNAGDIGFSGEAYQVFKNELHDAGVDMSRLTMAVSSQTQSLASARVGAGTAAAAYRELGLSAAAIEALPTDQRILAVAKAYHGATDQSKAFSAVSQILGTRGLPSLLGALKNLSTEGYGKLSEEMKEANRIMSDDTASRLRSAEKSLENLKQKATIVAGSVTGAMFAIGNSFRKDFFGTLSAFGGASTLSEAGVRNLLAEIMGNQPARPAEAPIPKMTDNGALAEELALRTRIAIAQETGKSAEGSFALEESIRIERRTAAMNEEYKLREKLIALVAANPTSDLSPEQQQLEITKLSEENKRLNDQIVNQRQSAAGKTAAAYRDTFDANNPDFLTPGQGVMAGFQQWATQAGSVGQQIQNSIGGALGSVSQSLSGIIMKTATWGDLGRSVGQLFLQTLVQIAVQLAAQEAIIPILTALHIGSEATKTAVTVAGATTRIAAHAAEAGAGAASAEASIPWVGPVLAIAAMVAVFAAVMALSNGFAAGGYTGPGGKYEPAGIVHRGEYVMDAATTSRIGVSRLDAMRFSGSAFSAGGAVGGGASAGGSAMVGRQERTIVFINTKEQGDLLMRDGRFQNSLIDYAKRRRGEIFSM